MAYTKVWADDPNLNEMEKKKLQKDGLDILNDIERYAQEGFASIPKDQWDYFKWAGLYLQRPKEDGYFMMRVNIPSGILTYAQAEVLAGIGRDYGRNLVDITTRQAVQFHWLEIEHIPDIFKRLASVGLSSVGACGDILRTIVGNPLAGIDPHELLDTTEIVQEVYHFFQRNYDFSNLPRKYKMSISANVHNAANAHIHCVSFVPATKVIDGEEVVGFHLWVGGGLSAKPYLAQELDVFIRPEQVKAAAIAVTTIFRDYGYRHKRHRARLKFLVADWGAEKFKDKLVELMGELPSKGTTQLKEWNAGYFYGVHPQKQEGLNYIGFNVPVGRLSADELWELARISKTYGQGEIRTCNSQNVVIPHIPDDQVDKLLKEPIFKRITIDPPSFTAYSVSCTGIEYCNLALVETKERMKQVAEYLDREVELDIPVRLHMTGCPNSCGQRQIADIGLQGVLMKGESGMVEAFDIYVGGTLEVEHAQFNQKLKGRILAEDVAPVLKQLLLYFKENRKSHETFFDFVQRIGLEQLQKVYDEILEKVA
ncbi:ferredoxin-nitrite reductase [Caldalkalibacillus uzonensis]|uniref:Ferredoxin-nitrite reductase n=1 Tax=Caldalkalibacillus uzonensis TaxID=353224 RepID=A0ABU0CV41_9BACI|nr:nitrite/sulfite reductase [Caldalkalibacillus uzonensis]MDQ0339987.1 ferredoxin-nitrite reductase [Caldalkalibacillus uzonensis]